MPKKQKAKKAKIKRKRTAKKSKPQKSKAKNAFTSVVSDDALERAAGRSITYECD